MPIEGVAAELVVIGTAAFLIVAGEVAVHSYLTSNNKERCGAYNDQLSCHAFNGHLSQYLDYNVILATPTTSIATTPATMRASFHA